VSRVLGNCSACVDVAMFVFSQSDSLAVVLSGEAFVAASWEDQICDLLLRGG